MNARPRMRPAFVETPADDTIVVQRIEDTATFQTLRQEWNELLQASASNCVFLTWEWLFAWWRNLSEGRRLSLITVRRGGRLIAIAPLAVRPRSLSRLLPWPSLEFLGTGLAGSDYLDVIVRRGHEREGLAAVADALAAAGAVLELSHVPANVSAAAQLAGDLARRRGWTASASRINVCPFIKLSGHSWPSYLASLGSAHRYNVQRRLKNLTKQFDVRFEQATSEEQRREALELLIDLHNRRWSERGGSQSFATAALRAFYDDVSRSGLELGWLRLFILRLDGRPAAALHGYQYGGVFSFYQAGFDPAFAKQSVGLVTMALAIKSAIEEGADEYDLLHGDEPYKYQWADKTRDLERIELFSPCVRGQLSRQALGLSRIVRRMGRRVFGNALADWIVVAAALSE